LLRVVEDEAEYAEFRGAAYEAMLAALDVPIAERPSAAKLIDVETELSAERIEQFRRLFPPE
jgi:hypothetical protein